MNDFQKLLDTLKSELVCKLSNSCEFLPSRERDIYLVYKRQWLENKNIDSMFEEIDMLFFPIFSLESLRSELTEIRLNDFNSYVELLSYIDTPYMLHNILFVHEISTKEKWDNLIAILKAAPICQNKSDIFDTNLSSFIAPVILDIIISAFLNNDELSAKLEELINALKNREDGFYLVYHYLKYLISKEHKEENFYIIINKLCINYRKEAIKQFAPENEDIIIINDLQRDTSFCDTGILFSTNNNFLDDYRAVMHLLLENSINDDESAANEYTLQEKLLSTYKFVFSTDAKGFFTYDLTFYNKHTDIADLFICQENPVRAWTEIINTLNGAKYRLMYDNFSEQSSSIRYHIKFMCVVSLKMLDILCNGDDNDKKIAFDLWDITWNESVDLLRKYTCFNSEFLYQYISRLICYYYVYFIKIASHVDVMTLMKFFNDISSHPILILQTVYLLIANGIEFPDCFKENHKKFFIDVIHRAESIAKWNENYKWLDKVIKECYYILT